MKRTILILVVALACGAAGWCAHRFALLGFGGPSSSTAGSAQQTTEPGGAADDGSQTVVGMGRIEPAGGVIDVGAMMGDRLGRLLVEEGAKVKKGAQLAELESQSLRKLECEAAASQLQNAEGRLEVERQLADVKIQAAKLGVKKAEAAALGLSAQEKKIALLKVGLALAHKDQERIKGLSKELASEQERERQALLVQQAESELATGEAMMDQLASANKLGTEAAKLELLAAEEAKKQLPFAIPVGPLGVSRKLAEAQYARTQITAPCGGIVLKIHVRPGETIGNKPILQIAELQRMVVVAEVYENEIKHIRVGQRALVYSKALKSPYDQQGLQGTVVRIGQMINAPVLKSVDPFAPADRHVVEVRVELNEEGSRQAAALSNLQVDVRFLKRGQGPGVRGQGNAE